jgi:hypothetical protein
MMRSGKKNLNGSNSGVNGGIRRERIRRIIAKHHRVGDTMIVLHDELPESLKKSDRQFRSIVSGKVSQNSAYHFGRFDAINDVVLSDDPPPPRLDSDIWYSVVNSLEAGNVSYRRGLTKIRSDAVKSKK